MLQLPLIHISDCLLVHFTIKFLNLAVPHFSYSHIKESKGWLHFVERRPGWWGGGGLMPPGWPRSTQGWFDRKKSDQATSELNSFPLEFVCPASLWPLMNSSLWHFCHHYVPLRSGSVLNCCLQEKAGDTGPRVEVAGEKLRYWGYYCEPGIRIGVSMYNLT